MTVETGSAPSYNAWRTAQVLRGRGFEVIGIDSSDASLLALPGCCDRFYLEPLCLESLGEVLERERPELMVGNCSGVGVMYLASQLARSGALKRHGVRLAGASLEVIYRTQDRSLFKEVLMDAGLPVPRFVPAMSLNDGIKAMQRVGFPLVIRAHFTSGGRGAARVCNQEEFLEKLMMALNLSPAHEVTIEEDFTGWREFTCLAARDSGGETAVLALFEQLEMAGVHSGDSLWVHPVQTPGRELVYFIGEIAGKIARVLGLRGVMELGIMVHPRMEEVHVSGAVPGPGQGSVFARLAAGADLAGLNVLLDLDLGLDEARSGPGALEAPGLAVRLPCDAGGGEGEAGLLGLERRSLGERVVMGRDSGEAAARLAAGLRRGAPLRSPEPVEGDRFQRMPPEKKLQYLQDRSAAGNLPVRRLQRDLPEWLYRLLREGAAGEAPPPPAPGGGLAEGGDDGKVLVLGGEPHHPGRGAESDHNVAQALAALLEAGRRPVLYGENPLVALVARDLGCEAVFGPLEPEAVLRCAAARGLREVITQFGGEASLALTPALIEGGCRVPGLSLELASFRGSSLREPRLFGEAGPRIAAEEEVATLERALEWAEEVGYPHMVYPSGPRGSGRTSIVYGPEDLREYYREAMEPGEGRLTMRPLYEDATEVMVEVLAGGGGPVILGLAQSLDDAGSASDDCMLAVPPLSLTGEQVEGVISYVREAVDGLPVAGNLRARVALKDGVMRLDELYLGASPTLPFLGLATGRPVQAWGVRAILGLDHGAAGEAAAPGRGMALRRTILPARIAGEEDILPVSVRRSQGSVAGLGRDLGSAFMKAHMEEMSFQPGRRRLFISVANRDKRSAVMMAKEMMAMGFRVMATAGTAEALRRGGAEVKTVKKLREGRPNVLDLIKNGEVDLIVNTPRGKGPRSDGFYIRSASARYAVPCITNMHAATLLVEALTARREGRLAFTDVGSYRDPGEGGTA